VLPISFARVLQREGRQSLAAAKANLDAFAAHGEVLIELADEPTRDVVACELRLLGAQCTPEPTVYAATRPTQSAPHDGAIRADAAGAGRDAASAANAALPLSLAPRMSSSAAWQKAGWAALLLTGILGIRACRECSRPSHEELRATITRLQIGAAEQEARYGGISPAQKAANARLAAQADALLRLQDAGDVGVDAGTDIDADERTGAGP